MTDPKHPNLPGDSEATGRPFRSGPSGAPLTTRQQMVLRALASAFLAEAGAVASKTVAHLLPVKLSPASVRTTMAQLAERGLIEKAHASAGRMPTEEGLRVFVDGLLSSDVQLASYQQRDLEHSFEDAAGEAVVDLASHILSDRTRQLGFVVAPRLERMTLQHISLVRLSAERVLVVLVSASGQSHRRVIEAEGRNSQADLERMASALNERLQGRTLVELRDALAAELRTLRDEAGSSLRGALSLGLRALEESVDEVPDLVIASHLALLDQPEFDDPARIRELFTAVETGERLLELLNQVLESDKGDVSVTLGDDFEEAGLRRCAMVSAPYRNDRTALGVLGVIGPHRMDYARIIPLVDYCSRLVSQRLSATEN